MEEKNECAALMKAANPAKQVFAPIDPLQSAASHR